MRWLLSCALLLLVAGAALADSLSFTWVRSPDPRATGYVMVYGLSSGGYNQSTNVGNVAEATITGLTPGVMYYFAVYAYGENSLQSDFSNEVCWTIIPERPSAPENVRVQL
jgi:hypothetical protein